MDVRSNAVALAILQVVARRDGAYDWYNIVSRVDHLGLDKSTPAFHLLKVLVHEGYLVAEPDIRRNDARYRLTALGHAVLPVAAEERRPRRTCRATRPSPAGRPEATTLSAPSVLVWRSTRRDTGAAGRVAASGGT